MHALGLLLIGILTLPSAEPVAPGEADLAALKALMAQATDAFSRQDAAAMERVLAPRFTVVMGDQQVATDRAGIQAGIERWCQGATAPFASVAFAPTVDHHAELIAPGVATTAGTSIDTYRFKSGKTVRVDSRWTATVVKTDGGWRIAQLHLGIDPLDNPMMREALGMITSWSAIAAAVGLLSGLLVGWWFGRRGRA